MDEVLYQEHFDLQNKHWWFQSKKKIVLSFVKEALDGVIGPKILDAGCGTGLMLHELSLLGKVSAIEYSQEAIEFCKEHVDCDVRRGSFPNEVPFKQDSFDLIVCLDVIEHIEDDQGTVGILRSLLKANGTMVVTVPALMSLWSKWDDLNQHKRRYDRHGLKELLEKNGLTIEYLSYYNSLLLPAVALVRWYNNFFNKQGGELDTKMPWGVLNSLLRRIFSFEDTLLRYITFPLGVSLVALVRKAERDK